MYLLCLGVLVRSTVLFRGSLTVLFYSCRVATRPAWILLSFYVYIIYLLLLTLLDAGMAPTITLKMQIFNLLRPVDPDMYPQCKAPCTGVYSYIAHSAMSLERARAWAWGSGSWRVCGVWWLTKFPVNGDHADQILSGCWKTCHTPCLWIAVVLHDTFWDDMFKGLQKYNRWDKRKIKQKSSVLRLRKKGQNWKQRNTPSLPSDRSMPKDEERGETTTLVF